MVSNPIICCSAMHWVLTPRGMQCPHRQKTAGAVRPLERGQQPKSPPCSVRRSARGSDAQAGAGDKRGGGSEVGDGASPLHPLGTQEGGRETPSTPATPRSGPRV